MWENGCFSFSAYQHSTSLDVNSELDQFGKIMPVLLGMRNRLLMVVILLGKDSFGENNLRV